MTDRKLPQKQVHWARDYGDFVSDWFDNAKDVRGPHWRDDDPECIAVIRREWVEGQLPQYFTEEV
jgi:hypothetical protein